MTAWLLGNPKAMVPLDCVKPLANEMLLLVVPPRIMFAVDDTGMDETVTPFRTNGPLPENVTDDELVPVAKFVKVLPIFTVPEEAKLALPLTAKVRFPGKV